MTIGKMCASIALAAGIALGSVTVASARDVTIVASPPEGALSERVSYADLDLASPAGARMLDLRVGGAVDRVCSPLDQRGSFSEHGVCKSFARSGARPQMDLAIERARQIAVNGTSAIAPVAIAIAAPQR